MIRWITLASVLLASSAFAQVTLPNNHKVPAPKPAQVIGKANGKTISAADIEPYLWEWYGKEALYDVLSYVIVSQDAAKKGIVISDAEVEKGIDDEIKSVQDNQKGTTAEAFEMLKGQGFTRSRLYLRIKATLLMDKLILADFRREDFVKVSTILVRTPTADASAIADAIKKSQGAYDDLKGGKDWGAVLATMTTDQKLISTKGALGWRALSLFPDSVQKEITSLPVGGYTHPAQTQFGIQIFRIDAHGADASGDELATLKNNYLMGARSKFMSDLKARANAQVLLK